LNVNKIMMVSESIGQLVNLKELGLGHNEITLIPESIKQLSNLRLLELKGNKIMNIPDSIRKLVNLQIIFDGTIENVRQIRERNNAYLYDQIDNIFDKSPQIKDLVTEELVALSTLNLKECAVCFENIDVKYVIVPCGHTSTCLGCLANLKTCPICKTDVEKYVKVYD